MSDLVITRIFDAPRELVYRAFTDPDQLAAWFGPVGWSVPRDSVELDVRPGGGQRFTMVNDEDPAMSSPVNAVFTQVVENELLVGEENVAHLPEFGAEVLRMTMAFSDEETGRTAWCSPRARSPRPWPTAPARAGAAASPSSTRFSPEHPHPRTPAPILGA